LVGAFYLNGGAGGAYVVRGPVAGEGSLGAHIRLEAAGRLDQAGWDVSQAGDVDGDGLGDVLVGALGDDTGAPDAGVAWLVPGPVVGGLLPDVGTALVGNASGDNAGKFVTDAGDVDGDGLDDVAVGAMQEDSAAPEAGAVYVVLGPVPAGALEAVAVAKLLGVATYDRAGNRVAAAYDVDQDGFADLAVGASGGFGTTYLVRGPLVGTTSLADADGLYVGLADGDSASRIEGQGDVDGDGFPDLLIGAPRADNAAEDGGSAYLLRGGALP
jgi:hypothetical protein